MFLLVPAYPGCPGSKAVTVVVVVVVTGQVDWLGLGVGGHPALSLHSSSEPGELSQ